MGISILLPKNYLVSVGLVLILILDLSVNLCQAQSSAPNKSKSRPIPWSRLSYQAKSIFGKVTTDIHFATLPIEEMAHLLIKDPEGNALLALGAGVVTVTVQTNINPLFGSSERLKTQSWCNPKDLAALQRVRLRRGKKIWQKSYRFMHNGVYHQRKKPLDKKGLELPPEQWTTVEEELYQYNGKGLGCPAVLEPNGLLYLLSRIDFMEQKSPISLCVFNKKQLHRVKIFASGNQRLKVNYLEKLRDKQIRKEETADATKISFQPYALVPEDKEPEEFSFLGLKGDFDIYLDEASNLPVLVSGKISTLGKVDIKLQEVEL